MSGSRRETGEKLRIAVLVSGSGSNLQALIEATSSGYAPAEIVRVIANVPGAGGLDRAIAAGIPALAIDHRAFPDRVRFEAALDRQLRSDRVELVCLAGFMRVLTPGFVEDWHDRLVNIHPSLLPAFPGLHTHRRALETGVRLHGCTVHIVRAELDNGPIVVQAAVPVLPGDDETTLQRRVLSAEHRAYPLALRLLASGEARIEGARVTIGSAAAGQVSDALLMSPQADRCGAAPADLRDRGGKG